MAERVKVWDWVREVAEREKTGQGAAKPVGIGEGLVQAACTTRMEKKAEAIRAAPAAVPIRKDFLRFNIGVMRIFNAMSYMVRFLMDSARAAGVER